MAGVRIYREATDPANIRRINIILRRRYGDFSHYNLKCPLNELIFILCSIKTHEQGYRSTYRALRRKFPRNSMLVSATENEIALAIKDGGLANQKAKKLKGIIQGVVQQYGKASLSFLKPESDEECEKFLCSLPGVGKKTARCVMLYSLSRKVFPVDTHCWRICRRLGWVRRTRPDGSCSPRDMDRLQSRIPAELRFSLHVNMVSLGRDICTARDPRCSICPISEYCKKIGIYRKRVCHT